MCGIAGGLFPRGITEQDLECALATIAHRGPDDSGGIIEGPLALGMRRLAVLDLDGGRQPVEDETGRVAVVFNGEIYNYREIAADLAISPAPGDTTVIAPLFARYGREMAHRLRGMFAVAAWDRKSRRLTLLRDRFGKKPLYYRRLPSGGFIFASELKALESLSQAAGLPLEIDEQGIYDFLSMAVVPQPNTVFRGVHLVGPGGYLCFDARRDVVQTGTYWSLEPSVIRRRRDRLHEEVRSRMREAVRVRLRSDVPLGVFLSGGLDSSIVALEAAALTEGDVHTFTVSTGDSELDEAPIARETAQSLGIRNTVLRLEVQPRESLERVVRHYDQPYADASAIPSMAIAALAREYVTVVLNGDGGDEVFAGYRRYLAAAAASRTPKAVAAAGRVGATAVLGAARRSRAGFVARFLRGAGMPVGRQYLTYTTDMLFEEDKRELWQRSRCRPTEAIVEDLPGCGHRGIHRQLFLDHRLNLQSDLLVKMDMATMAASLEARSPFLDHELAEFAVTIPPAELIRRGKTKAVLRDAYLGRLPDAVTKGKKRGFEIPLASWLADDWSDMIGDTVLAPSSEVASYLPADWIRDLYEGRVASDRNHAYLRYALLVLELWLRFRRRG
ncbi:MAG: asparagine synthase (glutamine-hydrolyzing) [Myxococcota bacterium]